MAFITVNFLAKSLNRTVNMNVLIPTDKFVAPGEKTPEKKPFRTLYLLHGLIGSQVDWVNGTRLQRWADTHNLCVVMPCGENKFYADSDITGDHFGEFIAQELVTFTRDTFNISHKREDTFIGGLSMGGYGAITNALRNPDVFGRVVALSSALIKEQILASVDELGHDFFTRTQYGAMFGLKDVAAFEGSACDYDALAEKVAASGGAMPSFYISCGTEDGLYAPNVAYKDRLLKLGYDVLWAPAPGVHDWDFWDSQIEKALAWLAPDENTAAVGSGHVVAVK